MNTTEQIILLILAVTLAIFLVTAITALVYIIRLVKSLQIIAAKAEQLVDSAESVGAMVKQTVGRLSLLRFVKSVVDLVHSKDK